MSKRIILSAALIVLIMLMSDSLLTPQTENRKVAEVFDINLKTGEIQVASPKASEEIKMHDLLYINIEGKTVILKAIFPMMTLARCKPEGSNRALWKKAKKGMPVYRWNKSINDDETAVIPSKPGEIRTFAGIEMAYIPDSKASSFWIGKYEVTQKQYEAIIKKNPSRFNGKPNHPVEQVSWYDAVDFCNKLSEKAGLKPYYNIDKKNKDPENTFDFDTVKWIVTTNNDSNGFRLPTSDEWEYAARAETTSTYYWGESSEIEVVNQYVVYEENSFKKGEGHIDYGTHVVGSKEPNVWGLYDMSGNVLEFCFDKHESSGNGIVFRTIRSASWKHNLIFLKTVSVNGCISNSKNDTIGFRLCRTAD